MDIRYCTSPCNYVIINNFYTDTELKEIWKELDFLTCENKLLSQDATSPAKDTLGNFLKRNLGVFLEEFYSKPIYSNICNINKKKINLDFFNNFSNDTVSILKKINYASTLVSYYENKDEYKFHWDESVLTVTSYFYKEPKKFSGGDFYFHTYDNKIEIKNNMSILFLSNELHAVDIVRMKDNSRLSGLGRYCITQFYYIVPSQFKNIDII